MPRDTRPSRSPLARAAGGQYRGPRGSTEAPTGGENMLGAARHVLYRSPPKRGGDSVAAGHVAAPEPSRAVERGKCYLTHGWPRALPGWEAGPGAMGHVAACHCTPCFRS
jgi:hypothetical protein